MIKNTSSGSSRHLARGAAISSLAVMGSRIMGLLREQIFAFFFGASREYDAFLTAFRIPNLLRDLLAEGALSAAFVTTFTKELQGHGKERAFHLGNVVMNTLSLVLMLTVLLGMVFAPSIVNAIAYGFDPQKAELATTLTRIMMPYIFFVAAAAVFMGMLNAQGYYAVPQSASTFFNITSIVVGLVGAYILAPEYITGIMQRSSSIHPGDIARAMIGMAIGTLFGGLVQWLIQAPTLYATGFRWRPVLDWQDPQFIAVLKLMGPAIVGAAAVQLNVFVNSNFASLLGDKPMSWLNYSFRLMQFPLGLFGVSVMTAALPAMSRHMAAKDHLAFGNTFTRSLELVLLLTLPAAVGLALLGEPIMRLIYEHGRFSHSDTLATAAALSAYAYGLPGYAAIKIVQPAYIAMGDAKTPMYTSLAAVGCNAALNYYFIRVLGVGHVGLAISTSIMATLNVSVLILILERRRHTLERARLAQQTLRMMLASALMGLFVWAGYQYLQNLHFDVGSFSAFVELMILIPAAMVIYGLSAWLLQVATLNAAWVLVRNRLRRKA